MNPALLRWLILLFCMLLMPARADDAATGAPHPEALAAYTLGKQFYDAGDFGKARSKFLDAARLEPGNARWHYNLGLTHRQMDNPQAARQAFMRARQLAPDYKREEIDQKLVSMGFDPAAPADALVPSPQAQREGNFDSESDGLLLPFAFVAFVAAITVVAVIVRRRRRATSNDAGNADRLSGSRRGRRTAPPAQDAKHSKTVDKALLSSAGKRIEAVSTTLIDIEHAMRLGEDAELRTALDHATRVEHAAYRLLDELRQGNGSLAQLDAAIDAATVAAADAMAVRDLRHANAADGKGDRIGCFFCARPLANPDYRRPVGLRRGTAADTVLACPECAATAATGTPDVRTFGGQERHWSEDPAFDPYARRHSASGARQPLPIWRLRSARPFGELAGLAAGGALAGAAGAGLMALAANANAGDAPLLDLDAAAAAGQATEAARAAAERAAAGRRDSSLRDES